MTPQEIITEAQLIGIRIILNPTGGLSLVGNTDFATETLKSLVRANREEIIQHLKRTAPLPAGINPEAQPTKKYVVGQNNMVFTTATGPTIGVTRAVGITSESDSVRFPADLFTPTINAVKRLGLSGGVTPANVVNTFNGGTGHITFTINGSTGSNITGATMFNIEVVNTFNGATGSIEGVNTFNGATGSIVGVNSVNGQTGAVTLVDLIGVSTVNGVSGDVQVVSTFNGATGSIVGVNSVNGNTGAVTITSTTVNGVAGNVEAVSSFNGNTGTVEGVASVNGATGAVTNIAAINATNLFSSNQEFAGSVAVSGGISMQTSGITFPDGTHQNTAASSSKQVAHFTIQASSSIAANEKLDALKFVPENSTVTEVGLKTSITGGVTASFVQAGTDPFGAATTGARTLATIELGQTGNDFGFTSSTIASSAITGGSFVYLDVTSISGGITGLQAFMTFEGA